jgi:hypothetical protein
MGKDRPERYEERLGCASCFIVRRYTFWDGFASVCLLTSDDLDAVVAVVPYHWNNCPYCVHTKNEIGTKFMNKTREVWQSFGRDLQASSAKRLAASCRSELFNNDGFTLHNCLVANALSAPGSQ